MSQQSITNKLVANIKQTSSSSVNYITNQKVVCIDSSNNRIGINTLKPEYSLTISGDLSTNAVSAPYLYITNSGIIEELSVNFLFLEDSSINKLDFSFGKFNTISGDTIKANIIDVSEINLTSDFLQVNTISCEDLSVNKIEVNNIDCCINAVFNDITINGLLNKSILNAETFNASLLTVDVSAFIKFLDCTDLSVTNISCDFLDVSNTGNFTNLNVDNSANFTDISVSGLSDLNDLSCNAISINGQDLNSFINNGINNYFDAGDQTLIFDTITVNNQIILNTSTQVGVNTGYFHPNKLIIPTNEYSDNNAVSFNNNILKIGNSELPFQNDIVYLILPEGEISGNKIIYDNNTNSYTLPDYECLMLDSSINDISSAKYSYLKYIPIKIDISSGSDNKFNLEDSSKITINNLVNDSKVKIDANVSVKYLNKIPGDVEVNNYEFGIFYNIGQKLYNYQSITNSIIVFDNSYNYATSSLNYYGTLETNTLFFLIGSPKDNSFIQIDNFHATITC